MSDSVNRVNRVVETTRKSYLEMAKEAEALLYTEKKEEVECTAPDFLDTERDAVMITRELASGEKTTLWGDTHIAPPLLKSSL